MSNNVSHLPEHGPIDENGREYYCLFWEGVQDVEYDFSRGFCVKGEDTAEFLEITLEKLGLTRREANEFIVFSKFLKQHKYLSLLLTIQFAYLTKLNILMLQVPILIQQ